MTTTRRALIRRETELEAELKSRRSPSEIQAATVIGAGSVRAGEPAHDEVDEEDAPTIERGRESASERQARMAIRRANRTTWQPIRFEGDR